MRARTILHVDMDAFFAAVEVREDPSLRGRAVVVGADPREGRGRGVVAAASYEARRFGIRSAMPISEAWRRCPDAVYLRPRGSLYAETSRRIFEIFHEHTDRVEPLSLDEAFLDVTASRALFGDGPAIAARIRERVREAQGLTASVGVASSKFVAKVASDLEKPDGLVVVPDGEERTFLADLGVERLWGAGPRARAELARLGVRTIGDVASLEPGVLEAAFGASVGRRFHRLARGEDDRPVRPDRRRKSLGRETTFSEDLMDRDRVQAALLGLCEEVARRLRRKDLAGATVTVKLRWEGFETTTRRTTLPAPIDTLERLWPAARGLLRKADREERAVRLVGVTVSGLVRGAGRQLSLFGGGGEPADAGVARVVDELTRRFGDGALTRAAALNRGREVRKKDDGDAPGKDSGAANPGRERPGRGRNGGSRTRGRGGLLLAAALAASIVGGACAGGPGPAEGPADRPGAPDDPPSPAEVTEGIHRAEGVGEMGGSLAWAGFAVGMELRTAERRHGGSLDLRPVEDACGEVGARIRHDDVELFLGFTGDSAAALLHTLVVRLPPDATREAVVADLKDRLPGLRYRPSRHWPDMPESENPKPLYVVPGVPEVGILVGIREGWMWISFLDCMD